MSETTPPSTPVPSFEQFMAATNVLIVDSNFTFRVALKQTLLSFGANADRIVVVKSLAEAKESIAKVKPEIIFSDFLLDDGIGTSLIKGQAHPPIFILISSVATQAAVANAAEVEVDQFIFKPYSQDHLKEVLQKVVIKKLTPSESVQMIEDGKELILQGEFEKAAVIFELVKKDPVYKSQALSYLGEIKKIKNELESAFKSFREGLGSTEVHFRCLMGLFQSLIAAEKTVEAYEVLKDIMMHFPECPERLSKALTLAVQTKNFVDIEEMYVVYQMMYEKTPKLINYMTSALMVNGHYHLKHKNQPAAIESFTRGVKVSQGQPKFTAYLKDKMSSYGLDSQVIEILKQVPESAPAPKSAPPKAA